MSHSLNKRSHWILEGEHQVRFRSEQTTKLTSSVTNKQDGKTSVGTNRTLKISIIRSIWETGTDHGKYHFDVSAIPYKVMKFRVVGQHLRANNPIHHKLIQKRRYPNIPVIIFYQIPHRRSLNDGVTTGNSEGGIKIVRRTVGGALTNRWTTRKFENRVPVSLF